MRKSIFILLLTCSFSGAFSQQHTQGNNDLWKQIYRATPAKINDLVHTKLNVSFDFDKSWAYGKAWITLKPHFYATDSLTLDAKGMAIKEVALIKGNSEIKLKYQYDNWKLEIQLDKMYKAGENYTIYIDYISKPDELDVKGSAAITDAKGLYFINPKGEKEGPTQIWTQGETEGSSVWFPTIDEPGQKCTQEISMTVPSKYVTLSNGLMISQKKNGDGTRTDNWKMDLPNSPYLFFMGVGEYVIVKDYYKKMSVDYYVEKEYASVAKKIFGETPGMIGFFEKITGVPYVWPKYAQIVGRDYVSGAMENTTATLHQESAYQNARQLVDGNAWESTISHELFHHWFGDLVTAESWSNLTLNESFANYSEYLWDEYRHGKDAADAHAFEDMQGYLMSRSDSKDLVRYYYQDKEDMFDAVSYNKGGRILHMLRNYVGDSAFFKSLNKYLTTNKFKSAEAAQLRLAFEDITGKDLNWFWNQWYFGSGSPELNINYDYQPGTARVIVNQTQKDGKLFILPTAIDVYQGKNKVRYSVWLKNAADTFYFPSASKPTLINVDADKILLASKTDNKSAEEFEQQYKYGPNYLDRYEALDYFADNKMSALAGGLSDKFPGLRLFTLQKLEQGNSYKVANVLKNIEDIASNDPDKKVQALALELLANIKDTKYKDLFTRFANDSSYSVSGSALEGLAYLNVEAAYTLAKKFSDDAKGNLEIVVSRLLYDLGSEADFDLLLKRYKKMEASESKMIASLSFANYLIKIKNAADVKQGVEEILKYRNAIPAGEKPYIDPTLKQLFSKLSNAQKQYGNADLADFIGTSIP